MHIHTALSESLINQKINKPVFRLWDEPEESEANLKKHGEQTSASLIHETDTEWQQSEWNKYCSFNQVSIFQDRKIIFHLFFFLGTT